MFWQLNGLVDPKVVPISIGQSSMLKFKTNIKKITAQEKNSKGNMRRKKAEYSLHMQSCLKDKNFWVQQHWKQKTEREKENQTGMDRFQDYCKAKATSALYE